MNNGVGSGMTLSVNMLCVLTLRHHTYCALLLPSPYLLSDCFLLHTVVVAEPDDMYAKPQTPAFLFPSLLAWRAYGSGG